MSIAPVRLTYAVLLVADLARVERFYTEMFGMVVTVRDAETSATFLRLPSSRNHHDLALYGTGPDPASKQRASIGSHRLAWQVDTIEQLEQARLTLVNVGACTGGSSHGAVRSIYGADPDGNGFEVVWMLPGEAWGEYEDGAPAQDLDMPSELRRWSGVGTAGPIYGAEHGEEMFHRALDLDEAGQLEAAEQWYRRAALAGDSGAAYNLGLLLDRSGRKPETLQFFRQAAEAGHEQAADKARDSHSLLDQAIARP